LNVLASLLYPESVWYAGEIRAAHSVASALPLPQELAAIVSFAEGEMTTWHLERARFVACSVSPLIPMPDAPLTSRQLADALELVGRASLAGELCQLLLLNAVLRLEGIAPVVASQN
jgi:hypothetical protein